MSRRTATFTVVNGSDYRMVAFKGSELLEAARVSAPWSRLYGGWLLYPWQVADVVAQAEHLGIEVRGDVQSLEDSRRAGSDRGDVRAAEVHVERQVDDLDLQGHEPALRDLGARSLGVRSDTKTLIDADLSQREVSMSTTTTSKDDAAGEQLSLFGGEVA